MRTPDRAPEASVGRRPSRVAPDQTYGDLVVVGPDGWLPSDAGSTEAPRVGHRVRAWRCACVCGTVVRVRGSHPVAGQVRSCGCLGAFTGWGRRTDLDPRARSPGTRTFPVTKVGQTLAYLDWETRPARAYRLIDGRVNDEYGHQCIVAADLHRIRRDLAPKSRAKTTDKP